MKRAMLAVAAMVLAGAAVPAGAGPAPASNEVHVQGCVQAGVETRCLVLTDVMSGKLYNLLVSEPRPAVGDGIQFTGVPFDGVTVCMQGAPIKVTTWARKASLQCAKTPAPRQ